MPTLFDARKRVTVAALFLLLAQRAAAEPEAKPAEAGPYTETRLLAETLPYWQNEIAHYRKITHDPPEVVQQTVEFLNKFHESRKLESAAVLEPLLALGQKLAVRDTADPLVRVDYAALLNHQGKLLEAHAVGAVAAKQICASDYPVYTRLLTAVELWNLCVRLYSVPEAHKWRIEYGRCLVEFVKTASSPIEKRLLGRWIHADFEYLPLDMQADLYRQCQKLESENGWAVDLMGGMYEIGVAWRYRGDGYANTISPENYKLFTDHLSTAGERLSASWQKKPEFPFAAATMIIVVTAAEAETTARQWFDRSVAAQIDFGAAYAKYSWSLQPRWGGSLAAMLAFGEECAATKRYDTDVPLYYLVAISDVYRESNGAENLWLRPGVYEKAREICDGLAADPARSDERDWTRSKAWARSRLLGCAVQAQRHPEARKILDEWGSQIIPQVVGYEAKSFAAQVNRIYAKTGEEADLARELSPRLVESNRTQPAERIEIKSLLEKGLAGTRDERGKKWFRFWLNILQDEKDFDSGQWVDLSFDRSRMTWDGSLGNWVADGDRSIIGNNLSAGWEPLVLLTPRFHTPFEVEVTCEFLTDEPPPWAVSFQNVGLLVDLKVSNRFDYCRFYCSTVKREFGLSCGQPAQSFNYELAERKKQRRLRAVILENNCAFYLDDELSLASSREPQTLDSTIGISTLHCWSGSVRFSNMRVRKSTARPIEPTDSRDAMIAFRRGEGRRDPQPRNRMFDSALELSLQKKNPAAAAAACSAAIEHGLSGADVSLLLGQCYEADHRYTKALEQYLKALETKVDYVDALSSLARLEASCPNPDIRDAKNARLHATRACDLTEYKDWSAVESLALAAAENGDFDEALRRAGKALALARDADKPEIKEHIKLFEQKEPFRLKPEKPQVKSPGK